MNEPSSTRRRVNNVFRGSGGIQRRVRFERLREPGEMGLRPVRILTGHAPLGIRDYLPTDREVRFFTFLREPIARSLSHYFQIRDGATERQRLKHQALGLAPLPPRPTLADMLEAGYIHDNLHTRMLSGLVEPFGEVNAEMLAQAKQNLREGLAFFGITERFDESLVLAKRRLALRTVLNRSNRNVSQTRPRGNDVPAELSEAAERCNRYDVDLYHYAIELFDAAPERRELDFEVEVAALRAARAGGGIALDASAPNDFVGAEQLWRRLVQARARLLRLEWKQARSRGR